MQTDRAGRRDVGQAIYAGVDCIAIIRAVRREGPDRLINLAQGTVDVTDRLFDCTAEQVLQMTAASAVAVKPPGWMSPGGR